MRLTISENQVAEIVEVDDSDHFNPPLHYEDPYYIVLQGGRNFIAQFEFLTKEEIVNKKGKRKYFDFSLSKAQEFDSFSKALDIAIKFKENDSTGQEKFFIVGHTEAILVEKFAKLKIQEFKQNFN